MFTLGGSPYPGFSTEGMLRYLMSGQRMNCPELCPTEIYEIMRDCWKQNSQDRPMFSQVVERLGGILPSVSAFIYSRFL